MPEITRSDVAASEPKTEGEGTQLEPKPFNAAAVPPAQNTAVELEPDTSVARQPDEQPEADYVYPDDPSIPEQLRGKKAKEAAGLFGTLFTTSQQMAQYLRQQQAQPQLQPQAEPPKPMFEQDDFITGDPATIEQKLGRLFEQKAQPFIVDMYKNLTVQTMHTAKQTLPHYGKYEHEILSELSQLPINYTANFQTWKDAHDRVVSRHIDEITMERTRNKPPLPYTERGNGNPSQGGQSTELTADQRAIADGLGVDYQTFGRFATLYNQNSGGVDG